MADVRGTSGLGNAGFGNAGETAGKPPVTVRAGETSLAHIAKRLNLDVESLIRANPQLRDPNALKAGQDVHLPQVQETAGGQGPSATPFTAQVPGQAGEAASPASRIADPLVKSLVQTRLNQGAPGAFPAGRGGAVLYAKNDPVGAGSAAATKAATPKLPDDVAKVLEDGAKIPEANREFTGAQKAIASGDYAKAYTCLESLLRKQGEDVMTEPAVKATQTVRDQLGFLSRMQKAGVKADYPPTEGQLVDYFKTLKNDPAAARQAFQDYTKNFHAHPANVPGANFDVVYSKDDNKYNTHVPDSWSEVANRPVKGNPEHTGKQINDCEGFAFMAGKLLGAAGFKVAHHLSVYPGPNDISHSMVAFAHPKEKGFTVTSNDGVFQGSNEKAAAKEAFKYAAGSVTGKEHYYTGGTMAESQIQQVIKDKEL